MKGARAGMSTFYDAKLASQASRPWKPFSIRSQFHGPLSRLSHNPGKQAFSALKHVARPEQKRTTRIPQFPLIVCCASG